MNVLFVCKWNQGRSQIAEALFKKYTSKHACVSAGTHANEFPSVNLAMCAPLIVKVLKEWDIDVSQKTTTRLTEALVDEADKIVVISKHTDLPDYLKKNDKVIYWKIEDPDGKDYEYHKAMRNQIDLLVKNFIHTLH